MKLDRVTVTGADDSIDHVDLIRLTRDFPWVEFGILLSRNQEGAPRFPSRKWMQGLWTYASALRLSGHLCGGWLRDLCAGQQAFQIDRPDLGALFPRVQLNFHGQAHGVDAKAFAGALRAWDREEYIFQFDSVNDHLLTLATARGIRAAPLFDLSHGAGIEPANWPRNRGWPYSGYAGGLHPDKIVGQLARIAEAAGDTRIWIDIETHVRSHDDKQFDMFKVQKFLEAVAPFVVR